MVNKPNSIPDIVTSSQEFSPLNTMLNTTPALGKSRVLTTSLVAAPTFGFAGNCDFRTCVLDWFEFRVVDSPKISDLRTLPVGHSIDYGQYSFLNVGKRTRHYNFMFTVFHDGHEVATLLTGAYLPTLANTSVFQMSNWVFYSSKYVGADPVVNFMPLSNTLLSVLACSFQSIVRVDVAFDGVNGLETVSKDDVLFGHGGLYQRSQDVTRTSKTINCVEREIYYGSLQSNSCSKLYDKRREIDEKQAAQESPYKPWIQTYLDTFYKGASRVWRYEVTVKGRADEFREIGVNPFMCWGLIIQFCREHARRALDYRLADGVAEFGHRERLGILTSLDTVASPSRVTGDVVGFKTTHSAIASVAKQLLWYATVSDIHHPDKLHTAIDLLWSAYRANPDQMGYKVSKWANDFDRRLKVNKLPFQNILVGCETAQKAQAFCNYVLACGIEGATTTNFKFSDGNIFHSHRVNGDTNQPLKLPRIE